MCLLDFDTDTCLFGVFDGKWFLDSYYYYFILFFFDFLFLTIYFLTYRSTNVQVMEVPRSPSTLRKNFQHF